MIYVIISFVCPKGLTTLDNASRVSKGFRMHAKRKLNIYRKLLKPRSNADLKWRVKQWLKDSR